jgi:hypothetical protein
VFARALSLLLLGFIVYGTTVEAAHAHGNLGGARISAGSSSFSDPAAKTKGKTNPLSCTDCLICQLHQHFSASLISLPPSMSPPAFLVPFFHSATTAFHSQTNTPRIGRAPPQASI